MSVESTNTSSSLPSINPSSKPANVEFLRRLNLDTSVLEKMAQISEIAVERLLYQHYSQETQPESIKAATKVVQDPITERIAAAKLFPSIKDKIRELKTPGPESLTHEEALANDEYISWATEIDSFEKQMILLFGDDREFVENLQENLTKLKDLYSLRDVEILDKSRGLNELNEVDSKIEKLQRNVAKSITEQTAKKPDYAELEVAGAKLIVGILKGIKLKKQLSGGDKSDQSMRVLLEALKEQRFKAGKGSHVTDPEMKRELYGHVKSIQEWTHHLDQVIIKTNQGPLSHLLDLKPSIRRDKQTMEHNVSELKQLIEEYYSQFEFEKDDDQIQSFQDLSIEAHLPKRLHLLLYINDILEGGKNEAEACRQKLLETYGREYLKINYREFDINDQPGSALDQYLEQFDRFLILQKAVMRYKKLGLEHASDAKAKEAEELLLSLKKINMDENERKFAGDYIRLRTAPFEKFLDTLMNSKEHEELLKVLLHKLKPINEFDNKIKQLKKDAFKHEHLGNSNTEENLSLDEKEWKQQQKDAKEAITEIFGKLKSYYIAMGAELPELKIDPERAAKTLQQARDDVMADRSRWDVPIDRKIEHSPGPLSSQLGKVKKVSVRHKMECPNIGYPSSNFRGRKRAYDVHQPNLFRVTLTNEEGVKLGDYTSSATNVEFFLEPKVDRSHARKESNLQQTMEILVGKVDHKWGEVSDKAAGTRDNPLILDVPITNLLSPDALRDWAFASGSSMFDASKIEQRMLLESEKAWKAFDRTNETSPLEKSEQKKFTIEMKDGTKRVVTPVVVNGKLFFKMNVKDKSGQSKEIYVQFDITCYDIGTNRIAKNMNEAAFGKGMEELAGYILKPLKYLKFWGKPLAEYKSENYGNTILDKMNAAAFKRDTDKYFEKIGKFKQEQEELKTKIINAEGSLGKEIEDIQQMISGGTTLDTKDERPGLSILRERLVAAERQYRDAKGKEEIEIKDKARQAAFRKWQAQRIELAQRLDVELNSSKHSPDRLAFLASIKKEQDLTDIYDEVKDLLTSNEHRTTKYMQQNMYLLSSALVAFGIELGADPHTGCRSGKDRTSVQRVEIATRLMTKEAFGRHINYREQTEFPLIAEIRRNLWLNSGQIDDVPIRNTTGKGINLSGNYGPLIKEDGISPWWEKNVLFGTKDVFQRTLK